MASEKYHSVDGQHGGLVLDLKSRKVLEGVCRKQSAQDSPDNGRDQNPMEILSHRTKQVSLIWEVEVHLSARWRRLDGMKDHSGY